MVYIVYESQFIKQIIYFFFLSFFFFFFSPSFSFFLFFSSSLHRPQLHRSSLFGLRLLLSPPNDASKPRQGGTPAAVATRIPSSAHDAERRLGRSARSRVVAVGDGNKAAWRRARLLWRETAAGNRCRRREATESNEARGVLLFT
jgi:hypothetical protein